MENISTGSSDLNKWLNGGYEKDVVTMIAGGPGSGKTNLCTLAACSIANSGKKVIFIDTEGGFSISRVRQIVGEGYSEILENIMLLSPTSSVEQKESFEKLSKNIKGDDIGLIIVDSMAMHYRLELGDAASLKDDEKVKEINRDIARQMKVLVEIARKKNIPVVVTNQVYSVFRDAENTKFGFDKETNIVGGDLMQYWSKCIIELKRDGHRRKAVLLKHRSLPYNDFNFEIKNSGISKAGWF